MKKGKKKGKCLLLFRVVSLVGIGLCWVLPVEAAPEYRLKAAFLYNIARLVEWPQESVATATQPFPICFMGEDVFGDALDSLKEKQVRNRPVQLQKNVSLAQVEQCYILFISNSEKDRLEEILRALKKKPVLTVGDSEGFAERGTVVNMLRDDKKVRLEINSQAAKRANLNVSPTLFELSTPVEDKFKE